MGDQRLFRGQFEFEMISQEVPDTLLDVLGIAAWSIKFDFCRFQGFAEVSLLGAIEGMDRPSHRAQGGSHGQYNPPAPQAVVPEATRSATPCRATATGPKGPPSSTPGGPSPPATARVGPYSLGSPRTGLHTPDPSPIRPPRRRCHPDSRR